MLVDGYCSKACLHEWADEHFQATHIAHVRASDLCSNLCQMLPCFGTFFRQLRSTGLSRLGLSRFGSPLVLRQALSRLGSLSWDQLTQLRVFPIIMLFCVCWLIIMLECQFCPSVSVCVSRLCTLCLLFESAHLACICVLCCLCLSYIHAMLIHTSGNAYDPAPLCEPACTPRNSRRLSAA